VESAIPEPVTAETAIDEPAIGETAVMEPAITEPAVMEPAITEPAVAEPTATEPAAAEPAVAEPAVAEQALTEPTITEPAVAEPAPTEPAVVATSTTGAVGRPAVAAAIAEPGTAESSGRETETGGSEGAVDPWAKLIADPGHAPELLALAAVQTFGPKAKDWAAKTREDYPTADDRALARLAKQQFTRFGRVGSVFGAVAGSYAPVTLLGTAAITHAELVLHVAAAYGLDPTDPQRAVDLLVVTRVHPSKADAEAALAAARRPAYDAGGLSDAVWRFGRMMAAQAGGWTALRLANRLFPGTSLLAAILTSSASAQSVAARAESYYKRG
jgi:hypothetical protein